MLKYYKLYEDVIAPEFATHGAACFDIYAHLGEKIVSSRPNPKVVVYTMDNKKEERKVNMWAGGGDGAASGGAGGNGAAIGPPSGDGTAGTVPGGGGGGACTGGAFAAGKAGANGKVIVKAYG